MTKTLDASNYVSDRVFDGTRPLLADHAAKLKAIIYREHYFEIDCLLHDALKKTNDHLVDTHIRRALFWLKRCADGG